MSYLPVLHEPTGNNRSQHTAQSDTDDCVEESDRCRASIGHEPKVHKEEQDTDRTGG